MTEITLLITVGLSTIRSLEWYVELYAESGDLICLNTNIGPSVFLVLIAMNLLLVGLFFWPENDVLWWLNFVGLVTLAANVINDFSPELVLVALSIVFGLAYRRLLGLKHIWHWRGMLMVGLGVLAGLAITVFVIGSIEMWL